MNITPASVASPRSYLWKLVIYSTFAVFVWPMSENKIMAAERTNTSTSRKDPVIRLNYDEEQLRDRRKLARHCIAIEKDGMAIDPYVFLHGVDGKQKPGFFKARTSLSLQGFDALMKTSGESDPPLYRKDELRPPKGVPINERERRIPLRDGVVPEILAGAAKAPKGLLIFAHGGNNALDGAIERAEKYIDPLVKDGYYPLFICWNSNLVSAWGEHLVRVRNGVDYRQQRPLYGWATSPVYLATDLATAVVRAPRTLIENVASTFQAADPLAYRAYPDTRAATVRYIDFRDRSILFQNEYTNQTDPDRSGRAVGKQPLFDYEKRLAELTDAGDEEARLKRARRWNEWLAQLPRDETRGRAPMVVSMGEFRATSSDMISRAVGYVAFSPSKVAVTSVLTGGGESMWAMLNRRIDNMYYHDRSFEAGRGYSDTDRDLAAGDTTGIGALSVFFRQLEQRQDIKVTLFGHSMGAIIFNQALALFPKINCPTIVYMAPACSIGDFNIMVAPYLRAHPKTQFYNLCLHPRAEKRERSLGENWKGELVPRGSLLVWIDDFLEHPRSFPDRTLGQFENAMIAGRMFHPRLQQQIHLCALNARPDENGPVHHGDFSGYRFWIREFYQSPGWMTRADCTFEAANCPPFEPPAQTPAAKKAAKGAPKK